MHIDYAIHHITDGLNKIGIILIDFNHFILLIIFINIAENLNIDKLPVITGTTGIDQAKGCLPGTREVFLNELIQWIYNPVTLEDSSQVMIITGAAGTGKSSIAHTMALWLAENKHLGCFFGFNRSIGSEYWKLCFSTIAKKLAAVNVLYKQALHHALEEDASFIDSPDPAIQFNKWILNPIKATTLFGPFVIIIDALDESGNANIQGNLLEILLSNASELPVDVKILITSRPEKITMDIIEEKKNSGVLLVHKDLESIDLKSTQNDIAQFINVYFGKRHHLNLAKNLDEQDQNWKDILVTKSGGLFQWTSAACLFLSDDKFLRVSEPWNLLKDSKDGVLFDLYTSILQQQFHGLSNDNFKNMLLVFGCLVSVQKPISLEALCQLLPELEDIINIVIPKLGSLFKNVSDTNRKLAIQPLHASCRDFFYDDKIPFCISSVEQKAQYNLVFGCLNTMNQNVKFDICNVNTSFKPTQEIPGLKTTIDNNIPEACQYAAVYWGNHFSAEKMDNHDANALDKLINDFLEHKLFFWFEALSILNEMAKASMLIKHLKTWKKVI